MRFCCPHCRQPYYGTDSKGHLQPFEFDCVSCSRHISMDEMVLLPAEGWTEEQTRAAEVPWLRRKKIGFFPAWFGTIAMAMTAPSRLIRALPVEGQSRRALWFALLTNFCFLFIGVAMSWVVLAVIGMIFASGQPGHMTGIAGGAAFMTGFFTLIPLLCFTLALFLWALAAHLLLRITGPTRYGARRTFDALCYANGANILAAIPCCGPYMQAAAWIWSGVSATLMLRETHRVSAWRAGFAVFLPPVAVLAGSIALVAWLLSSSAGPMHGSWTHLQTNLQAERAGRAVLNWARSHDGVPPLHAAELVGAGQLMPSDFAMPPRSNDPETTINGVDVSLLYALAPADRSAAVDRIVSILPEGVVAHRVGDLVFTWHGMTLPPAGTPDARLWLAVGFSAGRTRLSAVCVDQSIQEFGIADLASRLNDQNQVRAASGLPPLPDLSGIKANTPAVRSVEPSP
ncbi:MAG: YIP1 family protein [Phycisphaerae bacterium]|nr:YIP1 family protein [Phycisphaerae bacterium]